MAPRTYEKAGPSNQAGVHLRPRPFTAKGSRATQMPATASLARDPSLLVARPADVLQLQRDAGNQAVTSLLALQRAPAKAAKPKPPEINGLIDLFNGFQELAVSVVHHNGRGLAIVKFGPDLDAKQHKLLTDVQRVLYLVHAGNGAQKKRGRARWPALATQLRAAVERAKTLGGIPKGKLAHVADVIEVIGADVVGKGLKGDDVAQSTQSHADFANGVGALVNVINDAYYDFTSGVMPINYKEVSAKQRASLAKVQFAATLNPVQRKLLERLRAALTYARTPGSAKQGLAEWRAIADDVFGALGGAAAVTEGGVGAIHSSLADIGEKLVKGSVYLEAHHAALAKVDLKNPAEALQAEKVKAIAQELIAAKDVADKATALTGAASIDAAMKAAGISSEVGGVIWELAKNPGEIIGKLEDLNKRGALGKVVTIADLGDKMLALRNAIYTVSLSAVKEFATRQGKAALEAGLKEAVDRWAKVGQWADDKLAVVAKVGKVAGVISLAVSTVKMIDALANGNWGAAAQELVSTGLGWAATAAGGAAGAATIGGIGLILAAEAEAISGAAAMIRYCREQNVREAALDFIGKCQDAADIEAKALLANLKVLGDPSFTGDREFVMKQMNSDAEWWHRHLLELQDFMHTKRPNAMGGRPDLQAAMGPQALKVLGSMPAPTWEGAAEQIKTVFAGANAMAAWVVKNYPRTKAA